MTSKVVYGFFSGLTLASFWLGFQTIAPAFGAELDGFAINTQDKSVTVTLFTDQRATYTTEHHGKQFTIILPDTQLSKEQLNNGLPVVIDNKNRFIGRAVPGEDGKVKIILPNLPANEYSVSIQQKRQGQSSATPSKSTESLTPRPAVKAEPESHFEKVAASFPKPAEKPATTSNRLKLNPAPAKTNQGGIWNPYVYRPADFQKTASKPAAQPAKKQAAPIAAPFTEPVSTISVAESVHQAFGEDNSRGNSGDPLWYLHSLPPSDATGRLEDNLQGPAAQMLPLGQNPLANVKPVSEKPAPSEIKELTAEIRNGFKSLPQWLIVTAAIFLGGIGLFSLIGGFVLLKILFSQRQLLGNIIPSSGVQPMTTIVPLYATPDTSIDLMTGTRNAKSGYSSRPSYGQTSLKFEDKASIQALDYLKNGSSSVTQAVYNTTLVKFPASGKQRSMGRRKISP